MDKGVTLRPAADGDQGPIRALLTAAGLPVDDLAVAPVEFVVAEREGEVIGAAGMEPLAPRMALLRSMAVKEGFRRDGVGSALLARLMEQADAQGVTELFLLTMTAATFFAARGFTPLARERAPEAVRAHAQFTALCPASAHLMSLLRSKP